MSAIKMGLLEKDSHKNIDPPSNAPDQSSGRHPAQGNSCNKMYPNKASWLMNCAMSKSMPLQLNPESTAEDDDISSLRTYRYLKLDASNDIDLPCPRKFVQTFQPARRRLSRSQSAYDNSSAVSTPESTPNSARPFETHSPAFEPSSRARLRASLHLDDLHLLRPPSVASMGEALMSKSVHSEADEAELSLWQAEWDCVR